MSQRLASPNVDNNLISKRIEAFARLYTTENLADWPTVKPADRRPVFLVGFPRSGTTLLEQILDAHPDVVASEERGGLDKAINLTDELLGNQRFNDEGRKIQIDYTNYGNVTAHQVERIRAAYLEEMGRYGSWPEGKVFVDKMPMNLYLVGFIKRIFPNAKIIVALRHPLDCVLSAWSQFFEMNIAMQHMLKLEWAASLHQKMFGVLTQYRKVLTLEEDLHFIRYEDLVADFDTEARQLLRFLALPWDEAVTHYDEHARSRGGAATPSYQGVTQKIYKNAMARWRHHEERMAFLRPYIAESCQQFDYDLPTQESSEGKAV